MPFFSGATIHEAPNGDNGKENRNYYCGFRCLGMSEVGGFRVLGLSV